MFYLRLYCVGHNMVKVYSDSHIFRKQDLFNDYNI